jgi:hypothetical protein
MHLITLCVPWLIGSGSYLLTPVRLMVYYKP